MNTLDLDKLTEKRKALMQKKHALIAQRKLGKARQVKTQIANINQQIAKVVTA